MAQGRLSGGRRYGLEVLDGPDVGGVRFLRYLQTARTYPRALSAGAA